MHRSDRGSQYASGDYQEALKSYGMIVSMSRKGCRHSALGYVSPAQHHAAWQSQQKMAA
jgi:transposase InsO family protein